jgi:PKD repeat protein
VTLTVTDLNNSSTRQKIGYINVTAAPVPTPTPAPTPSPTPSPTPAPGLVADFYGNVTSGPAPLAVQFSDESNGTPTAWEWSWGDLTVNDTARNPIHIFNTTGLYTVILTVTSADGSNTTRKAGYINVT